MILRGRRVVTDGAMIAAAIHIENGFITAVTPFDKSDDESDGPVFEGVILPGLVDTHVHINEPGRTDWEGFETATRAAAAGGVGWEAQPKAPSERAAAAARERRKDLVCEEWDMFIPFGTVGLRLFSPQCKR